VEDPALTAAAVGEAAVGEAADGKVVEPPPAVASALGGALPVDGTVTVMVAGRLSVPEASTTW
jgi:hypothetical protein